MLSLLVSAALSNAETPGVYGDNRQYLPMIDTSILKAKGYFSENQDNRIPIQRLNRFVSSFMVAKDDALGLASVFGHINSQFDATDFITNFTAYGMGGRISNEEVPTFLHYIDIDDVVEPGKYIVDIWARVITESGLNQSVLLYNETVELYEVRDFKTMAIVFIIYSAAASLLGSIVYLIFTKDKKRNVPTSSSRSAKKVVKDYSEVHGVERSPSPRSSSPSKRQPSPR